MNHEIHDPVLITSECGFAFGVIEAIVTTVQKSGETVQVYAVIYGNSSLSCAYDEALISDLPAPSAYGSYGITAAVERHPGYKWAMSESERRKNPPAIPAIMVDALAESIVAAAKAASIEGGAK